MSLIFVLDRESYRQFSEAADAAGLAGELRERAGNDVLMNRDIGVHAQVGADGQETVTLAFTYKIAAEIGRLGDNIRFLREQIRSDRVFQLLSRFPHRYHTVSTHTRWASVGAITEANCHPIDNLLAGGCCTDHGIIHVCLNGDIDNYLQLKAEHENDGGRFHHNITTDTKIIPLQVQKYIRQGHDVAEAFRRAVNDFEGSHAISMHTDLAPGKLFLAQKGSGQTIFVGLAGDHFMPTSEVYGFVEETSNFLKMDGEKVVAGAKGDTRGQIFVLDQDSNGGLEGVRACYYDGTPLALDAGSIKHTEITSRDIDRQNFPHYFLKEISESPLSVEKTLQNRWKVKSIDGKDQAVIDLDETVIPAKLRRALTAEGDTPSIRRVYFVGQGTAGVAALACADILDAYLADPAVQIRALKASELSGFTLQDSDDHQSMSDALVIAISQSGTTTDTNRTVDMVRDRGAHTLAIVNRRDSDITFKVDGVMYTSSGRDIEMSVASTKAFYSQIVAGALLGLFVARLKGRRNDDFVSAEVKRLLALPEQMRSVLNRHEAIGKSARRLAVQKTYWAAVGSGPNKAAADEIRIKLSELCYKTISSDYVEDKKHIDLSSEPLIIVCAAGTRDTVIGDLVKDTAIFRAHKATPVVIADEGEDRFTPYAEDVFQVPAVAEHLAPILNTLVGHIWGYYAALAINEGSRFLFKFQESIQKTIDDFSRRGIDVYEILLEKGFKEKIITFYNAFRRKKAKNRLPAIMGIDAASDLTLLLKYLAGKLPVSDFEIDFGCKGTPLNMFNQLFQRLGDAINAMARPVDAIKHQAKTVTVGTSRIRAKIEGFLFDTLDQYGFSPAQLTTHNIILVRNLQEIVSEVKGAIRYRIDNLSLLGEPTDETTIEVERKDGVLQPIPSRVEGDTKLKGTKMIIVREGNVYIGKGRKDNRSILVIPIISTNPETANFIEHLLLLNIGFKQNVPLPVKIKALGGKYEKIKNIVLENSRPWQDDFLEWVPMDELFGRSAEKIGEYIVAQEKVSNS
jgi:glucosamine--fructose-6-phosphate aminotransferase (isomerizing)